MWICAPFGLLMPAEIPAKYRKPGQEDTLQIRARRAKDLDILRALYMQGTLGPTIHSPEKDYEYRAYCERQDWKVALCLMTDDIDYSKFKPETEYKFEDRELHDFYTSVWGTCLRMLSTPKHRAEYWSGQNKKYGNYSPTGTGYPDPKAIGSVHMKRIDLTSGATGASPSRTDPELDRYEDWLWRNRDTSATRDIVLPEIAGWNGDEPEPKKTDLNTLMDQISDEIDALLDAQKVQGPIDHLKCKHKNDKNAKAHCRAKHRRMIERRLEVLHAQMDKSYRDFEKDFAEVSAVVGDGVDEPTDDPATWRGYVWDRDKNKQAVNN